MGATIALITKPRFATPRRKFSARRVMGGVGGPYKDSVVAGRNRSGPFAISAKHRKGVANSDRESANPLAGASKWATGPAGGLRCLLYYLSHPRLRAMCMGGSDFSRGRRARTISLDGQPSGVICQIAQMGRGENRRSDPPPPEIRPDAGRLETVVLSWEARACGVGGPNWMGQADFGFLPQGAISRAHLTD